MNITKLFLITLLNLLSTYTYGMKNDNNNQFNKEKSSALVDESFKGNPCYQTIEELIKNNADVNFEDEECSTPLCIICGQETLHFEIMKLLITNNAHLNTQDKDSYPPLHLICNNNPSVEIIKFFINNDADINLQNNYGDTPLLVACKQDEISVENIKLLVPKFKDDFSKTLLRVCQEKKEYRTLIFTFLLCLKTKNKVSLTFKIPKFINFEFFKYLVFPLLNEEIQNFMSIKNKYGKNALMVAKENNHKTIMTFFDEILS